MLGLMQNQQLLISSLIELADRHHGEAEVVSRRVEGDIHRYTYKQVAQRSRKVANALDKLNLAFSDRVATLAWNGYRHLEPVSYTHLDVYKRQSETRLTVKEVLDDLVADGLVAKGDADLALAGSKLERGELHPLVVIANKKLHQLQPPHQILGLEPLTEWLANKVGLPYLRIDPLKLCLLYTSRCV